MNRSLQTAYEMGQEYSSKLEEMVAGYESLSGIPVMADNTDFWNTEEVEKIESLAVLWWQIGRYNDPFYLMDTYTEDTNEQ